MFANLISGIESMKLRLDDDLDGAGGVDDAAVTANVEVELQVAKDAEDQAEIVEDAAEIDDTVAEDDQLMRNYAELERAYDAIKEFGYTRQAAMLVDPLGQLPTLNPTIPALENMEVVASPNDAVTVAALETIGGAIKGVWDRIVKMCQWLRERIGDLMTRAGAMFTNFDKKVATLRSAVAKAKVDPAKLQDKKVTMVSAADWKKAATALVQSHDALAKKIGALSSINPEGGSAPIHLADIAKVTMPTPTEGFGWTQADFSDTTASKLAEVIGGGLAKIAANTKKSTQIVEAYAKKRAASQDGPKAEGDDVAKSAMSSIKEAGNMANKNVVLAIRLLNMWTKAANVYLSAAEKPAAKKEGE